MIPLEQLFAANRIPLKDLSPGRHYTTCPQCSGTRTRAHQTLKCLGVTIEADASVRWGCNHCGWTGPEKGNGAGNGASGQPLTTYEYRDAAGVIRFRKVRNSPGREPRFWLQQPDGNGGWRKGTAGVDTGLLYRVNEVAQAIAAGRVICVAEGEKDADSLWRLGFAATCSAHGAHDATKRQKPKWYASHSAQLRGADLVVFNDNDAAGYEHADTTCNLSIGVARRMRRLDLKLAWPAIPKGGDVSDWLAAGHRREELVALIDAAPDYTPTKTAHPAKGVAANAGKTEGWLALCLVDEKGRVLANLANAMIALRADPSLESAFAFDEMAQSAVLMRPLPLAPKARHAGNGPIPRQARDEDFTQIQEWLQHQGLPRVSRETVGQAVHQRAREFRFHPVRDWLNSLEWDGTERLSSAFRTYFGATGSQEYLDGISRMFFISMVARVFRPGCKCDYMVVLEGEQGIQKSRACLALATEPFFSDALSDIHHKDAKQHLRGKWLIEVSELAAFTRAETETLKAFITRTSEKYRPPYGREDVAEPRQCVFIGSTNRETYIKDETGGRRFWPVKTGAFKIAELERDRDQLFAEAVDRYLHGERWWPDSAFEKEHIKPEQNDRYEGDPWEGPTADYLKSLQQTYVLEVARNALGFDAAAKVGSRDQHRIVAILTKLNWRRGKHDDRGTPYARG